MKMEEYVAKSMVKKELDIANLHSSIVDALQNIIDEIPAADVEEVKYGGWIDTGSGQQCSVCGEIQYRYDSYRYRCAYCGAKMT